MSEKRKNEHGGGGGGEASKRGKSSHGHKQSSGAWSKGKGRGGKPDEKRPFNTPDELLVTLNKLWSQLCSKELKKGTKSDDRAKICTDIYALCSGKFLKLAMKHDASRVLQALYAMGAPSQQTDMVQEVKPKLRELCMSKFGRRLVIKMIKSGAEEQRGILLKELIPWTSKLVTHKVGAKVVDQMYDVAAPAQRKGMMLQCCGREVMLLDDGAKDEDAESKGGGEERQSMLAGVLERHPTYKIKILARINEMLNIVIHKECLHSRLACALYCEYAAHADHKDIVDMVATSAPLCAQIAQQGPTMQGERVLLHIVSYGSAKDRKTIMKGLHGKFGDLARQEYGHRIVMRLLDTVDDTTMLTKTVLEDIGSKDLQRVTELCGHKYGRRPLLHVLAPRCKRYFDPSTIRDMAAAMVPAPAAADGGAPETVRLMPTSKKDPELRRTQVLAALSDVLSEWCTSTCTVALRSALAADVLVELLRTAAVKGSAITNMEELLQQVAESAVTVQRDNRDGSTEQEEVNDTQMLINDFVASKCFKRLVVEDVGGFARILFEKLADVLARCAKLKGGRFVVAALLKREDLHDEVAKILRADDSTDGWAQDAGCCRLFELM